MGRPATLFALSAALAALSFAFDLSMPMGIAGGVPYVALVLVGFWMPWRPAVFVLAGVGTVLTLLGLGLSPSGGMLWVALTNRFLALFAIWVTAVLGFQQITTAATTRQARATLEQWVQERTAELSATNANLEREIAERGRAEESLRGSEAQVKSIVDHSPAVIALKDTRGRYTLVNKRFERLHGITSDEARGRTAQDIFGSQIADPYSAHDSDVVETGSAIEREQQVPTTEGIRTFIEVKFPVLDPTGSPTAIGLIATDITERKQAEESVRESAQHIRAILDNVADSVVTADETGAIVSVNPAAERDFGYGADELIGRNVSILMAGPDKDRHDGYIQRYLRTGEARVLGVRAREVTGRRKDGSRFPVELAVGEMVVGGKRTFIGSMRDITERKKADEALREREEQVRLLLDSTAEAIYGIDLDGNCSFCNRACIEMLGYRDAGELMGKNLHELIHHTRADGTPYPGDECRIFQAFAKGEGSHVDDEVLWRADGSRFPAEYWSYPISRGGEVVGSVVAFLDITERKRAEEALRESERGLANAQRIARLGNWERDIARDELRWSDEIYRIFGLSPQEFGATHEDFLDVVHPEDREFVTRALDQALHENTPYSIDHRIVRPDGSVRVVHEQAEVILDDSGSPVRLSGTVHDITERKRAEEEKDKLEAQLRHAQKLESVGTLAGGIAHDFNNILTLVCGYADMALRGLPPNGDTRAHIEQVIKAGDRATDLVNQILLFSRQVEHDRKPVKLHLIVEEALKLLRASLPSTIEIRRDVDTGCDAVLADTGQIHQILINLCTNAFHAMRDGPGVLEVSLGMVEVDGEFLRSRPNLSGRKYVRLCVSDSGHGMDRATAERVFEPFFTTKGVEEGTGLGLSVVHGIVASHGGAITLDSEPGAGATFEVYLPPADGDVERNVPVDRPIPTVEARVLFVDDEVEIARMAEQMLGQLDYDISVRTSSVEALETFRAHPDRFDVVITDQTMPQMTGVELAGELLGIRPDVPIVLVTGFADLIPPEQQQSLGIKEFIMKPVVARDLSAAIQRAINQDHAAEA